MTWSSLDKSCHHSKKWSLWSPAQSARAAAARQATVGGDVVTHVSVGFLGFLEFEGVVGMKLTGYLNIVLNDWCIQGHEPFGQKFDEQENQEENGI
jgi:hypothetical protein